MALAEIKQGSSLREQVSEEEWGLRVDLAAAFRLVAHFGWDDLIFTHMSVRVPGPENHFLINPFGLMFEEITASSLVKIGLDGLPVMETKSMVNPAGFTIHSAIHTAREDAHCVIHLHTDQGLAVSAQKEGLMPLTQTALTLMEDLSYHDYCGIALDPGEKESIVADLGEKNLMILRNHGTLTVGSEVGQAFLRMYFLERACTAQTLALGGNAELNIPSDAARANTANQAKGFLFGPVAQLGWGALMRKAERLDPSFKE